MKPAQQIAQWADRLRDIAGMGAYFARNIYDKDNYRDIQQIAVEMFALATNVTADSLEPLRATVLARPTPVSVGDAAVVDAAGRLLLIRRADSGRWAMPGGALEVGETPAAGVIREAWEETGVRAEALALVGVHDSRLAGSESPHHMYHFLFLCRPVPGAAVNPEPSHKDETLGMGWFAEGELPEDMEPNHLVRIPEVFRVWRDGGATAAYFDRPAAEAEADAG